MAVELIEKPVSALNAREIVWVAQLIHGTYHTSIPDTWQQCPMLLCEFLRGRAGALSGNC
jgi:hypothetical protein